MWPGVHELICHSPGYFDAATYVVISPYIPKNLRVHQVMNPPGLQKKNGRIKNTRPDSSGAAVAESLRTSA